ncbi:MAG: nitrile hydratase subunit beta [Marinovum sp.]|nr:nitrile hydratase subunit beta [Marinovum sp.]
MNGPHDLGGRHGFGAVIPEDESILFHADWEKRVLGMTLAAGALGYWNIDASRHARECLPPATYLGASYYEIWLRALENLLITYGEVRDDELDAQAMLQPGLRVERRLDAKAVPSVLAAGGPADRPGPAPKFAIGDHVRTRNHQPSGHTRLPSYARGCRGVVTALHGAHVYPDSNARFEGENPQPLYTICFDARDLFGSDADPAHKVSIEAWEPYLDPA